MARAEADSICEACGNVNPEDTLLCKQCGNNLREQRVRRLNEAQAAVAAATTPPTRWLAHLLTVFGLLLILWTGLNVERIENWLTATQVSDSMQAADFFQGAQSAEFDKMSQELRQHPAAQSEISRALAQTSNPESLGGRYIITHQVLGRPVTVGEALANRRNGDLLFVAQFRQGPELRGQAKIEPGGTLRVTRAGVRADDQYMPASGFVQANDDRAGYQCYGVTPASEEGFEAVVYALVDEPANDVPPGPR